MAKNNRIVEHPWATRRNGGWILRIEPLVESLKKAEVADISGVRVGTKNLVKLLKLLPGDHCLVRLNDKLEVETVQGISRKDKNGNYRVSFYKPKHYYNSFRLFDGAWIPKFATYQVVIIKPRKF